MIPLRGLLIPAMAALILMVTCTRSRAADPPSIDCAAIRFYVAEHGKAKALAWAFRNGYSLAEIREARRCLIQNRRD